MGKRHKTAKTGDKGLYRARNEKKIVEQEDDDYMYDKIDRYHNEKEKEFLRLEGTQESTSDEEEEAVMDLGVGHSDVEGSSEDDDDDEDQESSVPREAKPAQEEEEEASSSSSDDEMEEPEDPRDWGRSRKAYYHGDTADLEIGQDEDDAFLEEEAAKQVQAKRYDEMAEEDFMLSDNEDEKQDESKATATRDVAKLSSKDKQKILDKQHPEILPLLSYFSDAVKDLPNTTVASRALFDDSKGQTAKAVGATKLGQRYLLTKEMLQASTALNLAMYLLVKMEHAEQEEQVDESFIRSHPVMLRLQQYNSLAQMLEERVEDKVDGLKVQLENLVKAAALMNGEDESDDDGSSNSSDSHHGSDNEEKESSDDDAGDDDVERKPSAEGSTAAQKAARERKVLTEARFALRPSEIHDKVKVSGRKRTIDFGDEGPEQTNTMSKALLSTLNSIEQRTASAKKRSASQTEQMDEEHEESEARRAIEMMEAELGKLSDEEHVEDGSDGDPELEDLDGDEDAFYQQVAKKSKSRKEERKKRYEVAPKFPRMEREVEGERAVSKAILKNRGLVAHKPKLNRNPRVKKREQYRKAVIRRKGAIREVRKDEGHKYGGEETGIKSNLSRSRKL